jgi:hypothetical protein
MGQAKQRQAEIQALKARVVMTPVIALRHLTDGTFEMVSFQAVLPAKGKNDKSALLEAICCKDWLHTPPVDFIIDYLLQTKSYQGAGQYGYLINFYEPGADEDAPVGAHSCRLIAAYQAERHAEIQENFMNEMKQNKLMSVKTY